MTPTKVYPLPRATLDWSIDEPVPINCWTSFEVLGMLIYALWGPRSLQGPGRLFQHDIKDGTPLSRIESEAHLRTGCERMWQALCGGDIEASYRNEDGSFGRIPPGNWRSLYRPHIEPNLILGKAYSGIASECPMSSIEGRAFLFDKEVAECWILSIVSDHVLPDPLLRPSAPISTHSSISLAQAVTWLADGVPKDCHAMREATVEQSAYVDHSLRLAMDDELWDTGGEREFEDFVATEMARAVRLNLAAERIERAIASQDIKAFGVFVPAGAAALQDCTLCQIDPNFMLHSVGVQMLHDQIGTVDNEDFEAYRASREAGYWKGVRFHAADLVRVWGDDAPREPYHADFSRPIKVTTTAESERRYRERVNTWSSSKPPTRAEDEDWCKAELGVARDRARELRRAFAPINWRARGRKKEIGGK